MNTSNQSTLSIINPIELGRKLKSFRLRANLSQLDLEIRLGKSVGSLSRIENGSVNPSKETILLIARELNLTPSETASLFDININSQAKEE